MDAKTENRNALAELQAWYLRSLAPKIAAAADAGTAEPEALAALDREVRQFLSLPADDLAQEAA